MFPEGPIIKCLISNMQTFLSYSCLPTVTPGFNKPIQVVNLTSTKGENASLECAAQGFPLHVEWKYQKKGEDFVRPCIASKTKMQHINSFIFYFLYSCNNQCYNIRHANFNCLPIPLAFKGLTLGSSPLLARLTIFCSLALILLPQSSFSERLPRRLPLFGD